MYTFCAALDDPRTHRLSDGLYRRLCVLGLSSWHLNQAAPSVSDHERSGIETRLAQLLRLIDYRFVVGDDA